MAIKGKKKEVVKEIDFQALIDRGGELDKERKKLEAELKKIKETLKKEMEKQGITDFEGSKWKYVIVPMKETIIDPKRLYQLLKKTARIIEFWNLIKVEITKTKGFLSAEDYEEIAYTGTGTPRSSFKEID